MFRLTTLALFAVASLLALDATPATARGGAAARKVVRGTPQQTLARFKAAFARGDQQAEWDTLSPGFKRRISKMAGRTVDVGDYTAMRNKHRNDPRLRELRQWLPTAHLTRIKYDGRGYADVTIRFGAPILVGQDVPVKMVNHDLWELWIKGEPQPYWGFTDDKSIRAYRSPKDNTSVVEMRDKKGKITWQKRFPAAKVRGYRVLNRWYFHNFGKMESELTNKLR